ncbi:MAG: hypothetical protein LGB58_02145 [Sulfurovum sp.]|nr:hypothetical protein [Sulfurovum sp.]
MTTEDIEKIEAENKAAQEAIDKSEALKRLLENPDYQTVIGVGFLKDYAQDLGEAIATNTGAYDTNKLCGNLIGINSFVEYTHRVAQAGAAGVQTIADNEKFIASGGEESEEELTEETVEE